jgi:hypothetical protein
MSLSARCFGQEFPENVLRDFINSPREIDKFFPKNIKSENNKFRNRGGLSLVHFIVGIDGTPGAYLGVFIFINFV